MLTRAIAGIAALTLALPATAQTVKPGALRTFRDWTVGCDNGGRCKAVVLAPADGSPDDWPGFMLSIERDAGPAGAVTIGLSGQEDARPPTAILIDGRPAATMRGSTITGVEAIRLAVALAAGSRATIRSGGKSAVNSLVGLSAALRHIDAEQKRAGTVGALVAKGAAPDIAAAPALPVVRALAATGKAATLPPARIAALRKAAGCGIAEYNDSPPAPEFHALGGGETLVLLPCDSGAYNFISSLHILGRDGKVRAAETDAPAGMNPDAKVPSVVNGSFERGILTSYAKARGIGDCGTIESFAWDGRRFRLTEQSEMGECRGSTDYITTWRARVTR